MLLQQIQQLQKTVMQLQAGQNNGGAAGSAQGGGSEEYPGYSGNDGAWGSYGGSGGCQSGGYGSGGGYGNSYGGGGGYGPNSGFGGGYGYNSSGGGHDRSPSVGSKKPSSGVKNNVAPEDIPSTEQRVILVSNIPSALSHPDALYHAFKGFGGVERVKILHNKRNTALIQMASASDAQRYVL